MSYMQNLEYVERFKPEHVYSFTGACIQCKALVTVPVKAKELHDYGQGMLMQHAMPSLSADQREFLISGMCGICFDKAFEE